SRCTFEELRYSRPFISTLGKIRSYVGQPQKLLEVCISCRFFYLERALGKFCNMTTKCCCTMSSQTQAREANKGHSHQIRNAMYRGSGNQLDRKDRKHSHTRKCGRESTHPMLKQLESSDHMSNGHKSVHLTCHHEMHNVIVIARTFIIFFIVI
ncbi:unnamed protein product, partial [Callosobruchus maculatus]